MRRIPTSARADRRPPGVGLLIWVAVEVAIIGYSNEPSLQAIYGILGVAIVLVAVRSLQGVGIGKGLSLAKC